MLAAFLRRFGLGRIIVILIIVVVGLQILHFTLLSQLESDTKLVYGKTEKKINAVMSQILQSLHNAHVLDSSGFYHVIRNIIKSKNSQVLQGDVTLATQSTANHLNELPELSDRWQGPVSMCLFTYDSDFRFAIGAMVYIHVCYPSVQNMVDFHLVYPINKPPNMEELDKLFNKKISCDLSFSDLDILNVDNYDISGIKYPHNVLRNVALKTARSDYIFVVDIDMLPSMNLRKNFVRFIEKKSKESEDSKITAYVVPSFEGQSVHSIPKTKAELLNSLDTGLVRPFYWEVCWSCQKLTGYDTWENLPDTSMMEAAYDVEWAHPWEPFYLAYKKHLPTYDERFKQYGFNRVSQICELHVAGYKFSVLNTGFVVHKGFKFPNKFHKSKTAEHKVNRQLYKKFQEELKTRYPQSSRTCNRQENMVANN